MNWNCEAALSSKDYKGIVFITFLRTRFHYHLLELAEIFLRIRFARSIIFVLPLYLSQDKFSVISLKAARSSTSFTSWINWIQNQLILMDNHGHGNNSLVEGIQFLGPCFQSWWSVLEKSSLPTARYVTRFEINWRTTESSQQVHLHECTISWSWSQIWADSRRRNRSWSIPRSESHNGRWYIKRLIFIASAIPRYTLVLKTALTVPRVHWFLDDFIITIIVRRLKRYTCRHMRVDCIFFDRCICD